jgi:hypothetical protein
MRRKIRLAVGQAVATRPQADPSGGHETRVRAPRDGVELFPGIDLEANAIVANECVGVHATSLMETLGYPR